MGNRHLSNINIRPKSMIKITIALRLLFASAMAYKRVLVLPPTEWTTCVAQYKFQENADQADAFFKFYGGYDQKLDHRMSELGWSLMRNGKSFFCCSMFCVWASMSQLWNQNLVLRLPKRAGSDSSPTAAKRKFLADLKRQNWWIGREGHLSLLPKMDEN